MSVSLRLAESGRLPDAWIRFGIRRRLAALADRLATGAGGSGLAGEDALSTGPLAVATGVANEQHYELPPEFFAAVLGPRLKYSCCHWSKGADTLERAEEEALAQVCRRSEMEDGLDVLDLGCGWGSLTLWIAEHFPESRVTAVSNSAVQGRLVRQRAASRRLANVEVMTADVNDFNPARRFDRIVSIEMVEHLRNWAALGERLSTWLVPGGRVFLHHFCHRDRPYFFEDRGPDDWMARHFFTGGLMPSERLFERFAGELELEERWRVDGRHYGRTANAWLEYLDRRSAEVEALLEPVYGAATGRWLQRWRIFFLACAELFSFRSGGEWFISHSRWRAP